MCNNGPKPVYIAKKAVTLHILRVQEIFLAAPRPEARTAPTREAATQVLPSLI